MSDQLILVDLYDHPIGTSGKAEIHRTGALHRAFSVFLHRDGKMLLQQRQKDKYHSGGLWANACCSHPRAGEALSDALPRRMTEELGCCCPVTEQFSFVYYSRYTQQMHEYEFDHVFLGECPQDAVFHPNPIEIEALRWVPFDQLETELRLYPDRFSSWFLIAAPRILAILQGDTL